MLSKYLFLICKLSHLLNYSVKIKLYMIIHMLVYLVLHNVIHIIIKNVINIIIHIEIYILHIIYDYIWFNISHLMTSHDIMICYMSSYVKQRNNDVFDYNRSLLLSVLNMCYSSIWCVYQWWYTLSMLIYISKYVYNFNHNTKRLSEIIY